VPDSDPLVALTAQSPRLQAVGTAEQRLARRRPLHPAARWRVHVGATERYRHTHICIALNLDVTRAPPTEMLAFRRKIPSLRRAGVILSFKSSKRNTDRKDLSTARFRRAGPLFTRLYKRRAVYTVSQKQEDTILLSVTCMLRQVV